MGNEIVLVIGVIVFGLVVISVVALKGRIELKSNLKRKLSFVADAAGDKEKPSERPPHHEKTQTDSIIPVPLLFLIILVFGAIIFFAVLIFLLQRIRLDKKNKN